MRRIATGLLALTWLFPLMAVINHSIIALGHIPLLPPAVGLLNSNRSILLLLALSSFLLVSSKKPSSKPLTLIGTAFLVWTGVSSISGLNAVGSAFFSTTWLAAALAMSSCRYFAPLKLEAPTRAALLHLPISIIAATAIFPVAGGDATSVSEPFQLGNVYSNWLLILLPFVVRDFFEQKGVYFWIALLSSTAALTSLALTFSRTAWILTLLQLSATILLLHKIPGKRFFLWCTISFTGLVALVLFKSHLGGNLFIFGVACLALATPLLEGLIFKASFQPLRRLGLSACLVACCFMYVSHNNVELQELASGRLERLAKGDNSARSRTEFWKAAIGIANDNPLLGTGPGNFALAYPQHQKRFYFYSDSPHSTSLELASELGWFGGLLFLAFLASYLWEVRRTWHNTPAQRMAILGIFFGLAHAQTDVTYQFASVWVTLALVAGALIPHSSQEAPAKKPVLRVGLCLIFGCALLLLSGTQRRYEFTSSMTDEKRISVECRTVSDRLPAWPDPAMKALQSGVFLAENASDSNTTTEILSQLRPYYERSMSWTRNNATAERIAGKYKRLLGESDEAEKHLLRSLELDPFNHPATYHQLFLLALQKQDKVQTQSWAQKILDSYPLEQLESAHTGHRIGLTSQLVPVLFDTADSLSPYNQPKKLEPIYRFLIQETKAPRAHYGLGICLWTQGKAKQGREQLEIAHRLNPNYPPPPTIRQ